MSRPELVLIVPMYNESARFAPADFSACLAAQPRVRFLFVDDGSTDDTAMRVRALVARDAERMTLLQLPRNQGKGEAVRLGMLAALRDAPGALVGYWDADLATPLSVVPDFLGVLDRSEAVQAVIGARVQLLGRQIRRRAARHYLGRVFATAASITLQAPVYDTQCGAKIFRPTAALAHALATPWRTQWVFDVELLHRLLQWQRVPVSAIWEQPVTHWDDVAGSHLRLRDFCRAPLDLWRIRRQRQAS